MGLLVALLVLPVPTGAVIRTGLLGYRRALCGFATNLGTHLADPDADVRLRADSRAPVTPLIETLTTTIAAPDRRSTASTGAPSQSGPGGRI